MIIPIHIVLNSKEKGITTIGSSNKTWRTKSSWKDCNRTATSRKLFKSLLRGLLCNSFFVSQRGKLRLSPFFMPTHQAHQGSPAGQPQARKDKQARHHDLACLGKGEAKPSRRFKGLLVYGIFCIIVGWLVRSVRDKTIVPN